MDVAKPFALTNSPYSDEYYQKVQSQYPNYQALIEHQGYQQPINHISTDHGFQEQQQPQYIDRKQLLVGQLRNNVRASGKGLAILYSLFVFIGGYVLILFFLQGEDYKLLERTYQHFYQSESYPQDNFASDGCKALIAANLNVVGFLGAFCWLHIFSICFVVGGKPWCTFIHAIVAILFAGLAAFASKQKCLATDIWATTIGQEHFPQNSWQSYAMMTAASLIGCLLGCNWKANEERAEQERKHLSLLIAL